MHDREGVRGEPRGGPNTPPMPMAPPPVPPGMNMDQSRTPVSAIVKINGYSFVIQIILVSITLLPKNNYLSFIRK